MSHIAAIADPAMSHIGPFSDMRPGPNGSVACPSESARKSHLARTEACAVCRVEGHVVAPLTLSEVVARRKERLDRAAAAERRPRLFVVEESA